MLIGSDGNDAVDLVFGFRVVAKHEIHIQIHVIALGRCISLVDLGVQILGFAKHHVIEAKCNVDRADDQQDPGEREADYHGIPIFILRLFLGYLCHNVPLVL